MARRILTASLLCVLLALLLWRFVPLSPAAAMASGLAGEHWYRLSLDGRHLGYWYTRNHRDATGNWVFESEQRFALGSPEPVATTARRVFAAAPPHRLLLAEHLQSGRGPARGVRIEARQEGYVAIRVPADGTAEQPLDWQYDLADYLEFELWLAAEEPAPGARRSVDTLDFDRSARIARAFEVVAENDAGYVIENPAPYAATRIELDRHFVPRHLTISGLFDLERTTRQDALAPRSALQAASYHIPVDRRLPDHTRVSRLVLGVQGSDDPRVLFGRVRKADGIWQLAVQAPSLVGGAVQPAHRADTLQIPSGHPEIASLARSVVAGIGSTIAQVQALTDFVHHFIAYQPGLPARNVLDVLQDRRGDCTEYADLLTALARSQGIPAATVFGLAYADGPEPAFAYHAWNELYVDGTWLAVDPTWGEGRIDATHIPLPDDEQAALLLLSGNLPLRFTVLDVEHFAD